MSRILMNPTYPAFFWIWMSGEFGGGTIGDILAPYDFGNGPRHHWGLDVFFGTLSVVCALIGLRYLNRLEDYDASVD